MKQKGLNTKEIGDLGESVACEYLVSKGFAIIERNYRRPWGEIDVIAKKKGTIYFVEVKTVSYETRHSLLTDVTHETWRPEERVDARKIRQIEKTLHSWLEQNRGQELWQVDVVAVRMVPHETYAVVKHFEAVVA